MGYRGHARKVNNIEYGAASCSDFNFLSDLIYHYQEKNNPDMYVNTESNEWKFEVEDFEKLVKYFNNLSKKEKNKIAKEYNISLEDLNYAIEDLNGWLEDGKKAGNGYITIDWF